MRLQGQNPDAGKDDGDLMSVAKDWAGELISGQTGTGRILVRRIQISYTSDLVTRGREISLSCQCLSTLLCSLGHT